MARKSEERKSFTIMTKKLYYENVYAREFDADVLGCEERDGRFYVVLDKTLFYPGGGGQPCDLGIINDVEVLEVLEHGDEIIHVLKSNIEGRNIHGVLNWDRRFELMQQHLGEHIFAGMLYNIRQLHTARMRIEGDNVSIDIDTPVDDSVILEAEYFANKAVWENIPVEILYPDMAEVKAYARKLPPENSILPIRIVKIKGVDYVPCCGLHVSSTGQVGLVKITSSENHKGGTRIYLKCGSAAYRWLDDLYHEVKKAEAELVCGYQGINDKILNLRSQINNLKSLNEATIIHYLEPLGEKLVSNAEVRGQYKIVRHVLKNSGQDEVKHLFKILTDNNREIIAFLAGESDNGTFLMFGTNRANKDVDVRPAFKGAMNILEGKGGGPSFCAQGGGKVFEGIASVIDGAVNELII